MDRKKCVKWLLFFLVAVSVFAGVVRGIRKEREEGQKDQIVLRFAVTSKTFVLDESNESLKTFIEKVYEYADETTYPTVDVFVVNGNVTGDGSVEAFEAVDKITASLLREDSKFYTAMGEMDFVVGENDLVDDPAIREKIADSCVYIKGYPFLFLSPIYASYEPKFQWLDEQLNTVTKYSDKPVFVFQHGSLMNTYYGSETWYTMESEPILAILEKYPQVVDFSSSTGSAANTFRSVFQKEATYVNTGVMMQVRMNYAEFGHDTSAEIINQQSATVSQCKIVEVYGDGKVEILTMDLNTGEIYETPDGTGWMKHVIYPGQKESYSYTVAQKGQDAPIFEENARIEVASETDKAVITFPNAKDVDGILFYELRLCDAKKNVIYTVNTYADFAMYDMPETKTYELGNLTANTDYYLEIVPYDIYGVSGNPISVDFSTN